MLYQHDNKSGLDRDAFVKEINGKRTGLFFLNNGKGTEIAVTNYGAVMPAIIIF